MWTNYFKIALRNLFRQKAQSAILIGGLAVGMTACLLLLQYVSFQLSFDNFHSKKAQIYRVVNERVQNGKTIQKGTITYPTIGKTMQKDFPEVVNHSRIIPGGSVFIKKGEKLVQHDGLLFVDQHFFEMFDFPFLAKEDDQLLDAPYEVILPRDVAMQFFPGAKGDFSAILGKEIFFNNDINPHKIVGVCENIPANSLLQFKIFSSFATYIAYNGEGADNSWTWSDFWHFVELKPGTDVAALEAKFPAFSNRYFQGTKVSGSKEIFTLQALNDAHLYSADLEYEIGVTTNGRAIWSLLIIAFFMLVLAWINYVNLSSVRAIERAKEVGVRKVVGAKRSALVGQFFTEALIVNVLAIGFALLATQLIKPWFANNFGLQPDALKLFGNGQYTLLLTMLALVLAGVLISGVYPAWLLSSTQISSVLKGAFNKTAGSGNVRKVLVVVQFTASIALITGTMLVSRQIKFMTQQDLGLQIDQIMTLEGPQLTQNDSIFFGKIKAFKTELRNNPHIKSITSSNRTIDENWHGRVFNVEKSSDQPSGEKFTSSFIFIDPDFTETYGLKLLAGRFYRETDLHIDLSDNHNVVLNASAVKLFGYSSVEDAVGQSIKFWNSEYTVIGVLPDFHELSLHTPIESLLFLPLYYPGNKLSLKLDGADMENTIAFARSTFDEFFPGNVFAYKFLNESYQKLYEADRQFSRILGFFTILTVLIACLGLFGLASYLTFLRTKEIGVRKVLGASVASITGLLAKDFLKLVILAVLIATPLSWYFMRQWLQDFAYHIQIQWWMFVLAGVLAVGVAFLTISVQSVKAALANPVKSLRSE